MAVVDFVLTPDKVKENAEAKATITLSRAADAGGQVVVLSASEEHIVKMPTTVTVPAGSSTLTFDIRAEENLPQRSYVILEAKINGTGRAAGFVVELK